MKGKSLQIKKYTKYEIALVVIIAASLFSIIYGFAFRKEGWHSDEVWSYGFANSYYKPNIYKDVDGKTDNINEWVNSKELNDYIEVNNGERFAFDSVYNNQINDLSPPLHSMILHAICSLFPNTFSWWYSFAINILSFIVCMVYLYKTAIVIKNNNLGIICCILYGLSLAARETYIYLRMYAMCTALLMILLYNVATYVTNDEQKNVLNKNLVGILIVSFLMFLTHYYMIPLVGLITLGVCSILLFGKKIKKAILYGIAQLASLFVSFALFPSVLNIFLSHQTRVDNAVAASLDYKLSVKIKVLVGFITYKLYGIHIYALTDLSWIKIGFVTIVCLMIVVMPVLYLIRETKFMTKFVGGIKSLLEFLRIWVRSVNKLYFLILFVVIGQIIVVAMTSQMNYMGWDEGRYIMYLYPMATLFFVGVIYVILEKIRKIKVRKLCTYIIVLFVLAVNIFFRYIDRYYYYPQYIQGESLQDVVKNKKCIFVSDSNWAIVYMTPILRYTDEYFQTWNEDYNKYGELYKEKSKEDVVIIIDESELREIDSMQKMGAVYEKDSLKQTQSKYADIIEYYKKLYSADKCEKVSTESVFLHRMVAYELK